MKDVFEDWFRLQRQMTVECTDSRFEVRPSQVLSGPSMAEIVQPTSCAIRWNRCPFDQAARASAGE